MIGLLLHLDSGTVRYSSSDVSAHGDQYGGRLEAPSANKGKVDRWFPLSSSLSRSTFRLRDQDGSLIRQFRDECVVGKRADVVWLNDEGAPRLATGIVRSWGGGPGAVNVSIEDPSLLRFGSPLGPIMSDIFDDVDESLAGNLVPQVFGRATRLPVGGGAVRDGAISLVASMGEREVTNVRYDGDLLDQSTWTTEVAGGSEPYTIIRVTGDTERRMNNFEWSGGQTTYTIGSMIIGILEQNGVGETEINRESFDAYDSLMVSRGLQRSGEIPEGAIVVAGTDETVSSILSRVQNSWGVMTYIGQDRRFHVEVPIWRSGLTVKEIDAASIFYSGWSMETPEGATKWTISSDRVWSGSSFAVARDIENVKNRQDFGREIEGRSIQQFYARGHSALNFGLDRVVLETWDRFRAAVTIDPRLDVEIGEFVEITGRTSTVQFPLDDPFLVDGIQVMGSGFQLRKEVSLTPVIGRGLLPLVATSGIANETFDEGSDIEIDMEPYFSVA